MATPRRVLECGLQGLYNAGSFGILKDDLTMMSSPFGSDVCRLFFRIQVPVSHKGSTKKAKSNQAESGGRKMRKLPEDYKSSTCDEDRFSGRMPRSRLFRSNLHTRTHNQLSIFQ